MTPLISLFVFVAMIGIITVIFKYPYKATKTVPEPTSPKEPLPIPAHAKNIFIKNWTLVDFHKEFGPKVKISKCTNHYTNEKYDCCTFTDKYGNTVYVGFYRQLGPLTKEELARRKYELFVGRTRSGFYRIYDSSVRGVEIIGEGIDLSKFM